MEKLPSAQFPISVNLLGKNYCRSVSFQYRYEKIGLERTSGKEVIQYLDGTLDLAHNADDQQKQEKQGQ